MKKLYGLSVVLLAALALGACATTQEEGGSYDEILTKAKATQKQAESMNYAWTVTDDAIKKSEEAAKEGDKDKALKLAKKAQGLAELSVKQAEAEKNAQPFYPE